MADRAQRIADFMGDAGGESAERGEFQLLGLLGDLREIFEKDQGLLIGALIESDEAGLQLQTIAGDFQALRAQCRVVQPQLQTFDQHG
jgi:hypothetical protein